MKPLAIDLFCGLGGWTEGLLAEGWDVVGFDLERHRYGEQKYPAALVIQDVLTLHGSQFKDATLIVASPPCQAYSYMAMPWRRSKYKAAAIQQDRSGQALADLNRLFLECFRIQREACEAAGRHVPMVVENVRGAQPWVGRARWNYGSFYLWGDVPALMPSTMERRHKIASSNSMFLDNPDRPFFKERGGIDGKGKTRVAGTKLPGFRFDGSGRSFQSDSVEGTKCGGDWFNAAQLSISRLTSSRSPDRKAASAMIAKIPLPLSRHIARVYRSPPVL